jgi:hypothetical protein
VNWPEAIVTIAGMICATSLIESILRFIGGMRQY